MSVDQILEENNIVDNHADRYVYLYDVLDLQKLVSHEVARSIWCRSWNKYQVDKGQRTDVSMIRMLDNPSLYDAYHKHTEQLVESLNTPRCIEDMLKNNLRDVGQKVVEWAKHFTFLMGFPCKFFKTHQCAAPIDPNWCVWSTDAGIDYIETAKKILKTDCLTDLQRFLVMCLYCMEDEIETFSLDTLPLEFVEGLNYHTGCEFFYWICKRKNELHKMPCEKLDAVFYVMTVRFNAHQRFSNKYFLNRLDDDFQAGAVSYWFCRIFKEKYDEVCRVTVCVFIEQIISTMTSYQQQRLLLDTSMYVLIIPFLALYSSSSRCALWAWRHSKDQMTLEECSHIFSKIVSESRKLSKIRTAALMSSLDEIWDTASDAQKNFIIQTQMYVLILDCLYNPCLSNLLSKLLNFISSAERKKLIFFLAEGYVVHQCDSRLLNVLMNVCLPLSDDQLEFKKFVIHSTDFRRCLHDLFRNQKYDMIDEKLKFYFPRDQWRI
ncbi:uncharacterized protein LOC135841148 [Planococcus citri]|uniref:uncharacterized protein LOC135841148 n=1 Tax=Planococcus citri TaxID=170843 RepID=UPI0031FA0FD3